MTKPRVKSSIYLNEELYQQVKVYSTATAIPLNTHIVLALQEYLQRKDRQSVIENKLHQRAKE